MAELSAPNLERKRSVVFIDTSEPQWLTLTPTISPTSDTASERSVTHDSTPRRNSSVYDVSSPQYKKAMQFERVPSPVSRRPAVPPPRKGFVVAAGDRVLRLQD
ncbi:hypothetical protein Tdes44962_MAKER01470 [Teratosphaeria destructans]|uniref:Uncharacterized protein n=1 Tax=Teratosphaeria destructans TaxID=418781 RepID=A0A9W7SZ17_9PEZI|nr:hypothetical protein Tdes44962_MAKER01470 [Teratosphaeria destructans]